MQAPLRDPVDSRLSSQEKTVSSSWSTWSLQAFDESCLRRLVVCHQVRCRIAPSAVCVWCREASAPVRRLVAYQSHIPIVRLLQIVLALAQSAEFVGSSNGHKLLMDVGRTGSVAFRRENKYHFDDFQPYHQLCAVSEPCFENDKPEVFAESLHQRGCERLPHASVASVV